jgi:hypothetical protein
MIIATLCLTAIRPPANAAPQQLSLATYCEITSRLLVLSEMEWKERVEAAEANAGDRESLLQALDTIFKRHVKLRSDQYEQYHTSAGEYGRFATNYKEEIRIYLEENVPIANDLDSARNRINGLIERFEAKMAPPPGDKK